MTSYRGASVGTETKRPSLESESAMTILSENLKFDGGEAHFKFHAKPVGGSSKHFTVTPELKGIFGGVASEIVKKLMQEVVIK